MTLNLAEQLIRRLATDPAFRQQLAALEPGLKRAFLDASGFRGVSVEWLASEALAAFKELTKGKDKVSEEDAMGAVTAATTAAAVVPGAASFALTGVPGGAPPAGASFALTGVPGAASFALTGVPGGAPPAGASFALTGVPGAASFALTGVPGGAPPAGASFALTGVPGAASFALTGVPGAAPPAGASFALTGVPAPEPKKDDDGEKS